MPPATHWLPSLLPRATDSLWYPHTSLARELEQLDLEEQQYHQALEDVGKGAPRPLGVSKIVQVQAEEDVSPDDTEVSDDVVDEASDDGV
ncbi:hypothetical protein HK102_007487 [Quaeritorhiza haematococci]|nr:hypothetical protein HK102_007487 [Quaeritorhiza haematococci]